MATSDAAWAALVTAREIGGGVWVVLETTRRRGPDGVVLVGTRPGPTVHLRRDCPAIRGMLRARLGRHAVGRVPAGTLLPRPVLRGAARNRVLLVDDEDICRRCEAKWVRAGGVGWS